MLRKNAILFGLFSLASLDFFLLGIQVISKGVAKNVAWTVFGFFVFVLLIQLAILAAVARLAANEKIKTAVAGLMLAGNIIAFYVAFFDKFLTFHKFQILLSGLVLAAIAGALLFLARRNQTLLKALVLVLIVNSLYTLVAVVTYDPNKGLTNPSSVLAQYQNIKFKAKPNIHFVAFDSLQPRNVVKSHMGFSPAYADLMRQSSTLVPNLFSTGSPTLNSFNSQFRLADKRLGGDGYFAGRLDSPLINILHANGYKLQTGFSEDYFGSKGAFVDEYDRLDAEDTVKNSTLCSLANKKEKLLKLYGFCLLYSHFSKEAPADKKKSNDWRQRVMDIISDKAHDSKQPWMTIDYVYNPIGHTPVTYKGTDTVTRNKYIEVYKRKSKEDVVQMLTKLVETIKKDDPNSIVFVYGDHGPILSRALPVDQNPAFNVPDRFAVFGAVYKNANPCSDLTNINHYQQKSYMTIERLTAGIFRCLAKDPTTVDKAVNFQEPYDYNNYLYDK